MYYIEGVYIMELETEYDQIEPGDILLSRILTKPKTYTVKDLTDEKLKIESGEIGRTELQKPSIEKGLEMGILTVVKG